MVARPDYLPKPFADTGDKNIIPTEPVPTSPGSASLELGFPPITKLPTEEGGLPPLQEDFNGAYYQVYTFAIWQQSGGKALWDNRVDEYPVGVVLNGSDGIEYKCITPNGSSTVSVDPVTDTARTTWVLYDRGYHAGDDINLSYVPSAQTMIDRRILQRNGASLLRTDFPELFAAIGVSYGSVDSTHFNLPDDRGLFERIWDNGAGVDPDATSRINRGDGTTGDNVGTKQANQIQSHTHLADQRSSVADGSNSFAATGGTAAGEGNISLSNTGGNETRPANIYKWGGIFY